MAEYQRVYKDIGGGAGWSWVSEEITGGAAQTAHELVGGNAVTIPDGGQTRLTWNTKILGSDLLDLAAPTAPTVITAGVYAFTAITLPAEPLTAGSSYQALLDVDTDGDDGSAYLTVVASASDLTPFASVACTYYVPAGGKIVVQVKNNDSVPRDFLLNQATIQRIT